MLEPLSSTRSPHLQAPSQFSRTCISPSSSLSLEERKPGTDYSLQTTNLHTASPAKGLFSPMLDEALRRIEDFSRLTLHFIMHHIGISKTKPNQKIKPSEKPQTCNSPCLHTACTTTTSFKRRTLFSTSDLYGMNNMIDCTHSVQVCMYDGLISLKIKTEKLRTSKIKNLSC